MSEPTTEVVTTPVFDLDAAFDANVVNYSTVKAHGGVFRLCSLTTDEILDWLGESNDEKKKKLSGLRLAVRCICDAEGKRYIGPDGRTNTRYEAVVTKFATKEAFGNKLLVAAAMELNGMGDIAKAMAAAKNG